ncbi:hypothetical protein IFR04_004637 [Cadophora malorum]|uniref:MARVEL domain-containing protein n=1 Tax=Cadophora malorum TaxID=108018 RepID=A0A8H8BRY5_9HELO|nr:hypothetical protein IFR04_004637 [Cadophora malorum]
MALTGGLLRMVMIGCYVLAFCCATIITGAFGWFTARHNFTTRNIASVSIGSITMVYTLVCILVTCCTAGISFFALISIVMDVIFTALMIAVVAINRSARYGCDAPPPYPRVVYDGSGESGCELFVASWAVAIIAIFLFLVAAVTQWMIRSRGRSRVGSKV